MKQRLFITELGLIPAASAFEPTKMETTHFNTKPSPFKMNHTSSVAVWAPVMSNWQEIPLNNITDCFKTDAIIKHLI